MKIYTCPVCEGTGKEYCTNPDHGLGDREGSSFNCPCCGYGPTREIKNSCGHCEACEGLGVVYNEYPFNSRFEEYTSHLDINLDEYEISSDKIPHCYDPTQVQHESGKYYKHDQVQWLMITQEPHECHMRNFEYGGLYVGYITWVGYEDYVVARKENGNILLEEMKYDFDLPLEIFSPINDEDILPIIQSGNMIFDLTPEQLDELRNSSHNPYTVAEGTNSKNVDSEMPLITLSAVRSRTRFTVIKMDTL